MKALWIARAQPFPLDTGDRIYTARLLRAVAQAGADITFAGFPCEPPAVVPADWPVRWRLVPGTPRGTARSLLSTMPLVAASHATPAYRQLVEELAQETWDFVVFDQYGLGWAMAPFLKARAGRAAPVLVHVAHDHEASVYTSLVRGFKGSVFKHAGLWQNLIKTRAIERHIARTVDLVTAITLEDAEKFHADAPDTATVVLTPGYDGVVSTRERMPADTPRNVIMVGNYHWVAKSENLRQFVAAADALFHQNGITLHVIGGIPDDLAAELRRSSRATVIHGFVDEIASHFAQARLAIVPEAIGGGFKLKFLDYIFNRVAVATLAYAAAGLPQDIRASMLQSDNLAGLARAIVEAIGDHERLNGMQQRAFVAAQSRYRWPDRGNDLLAAVRSARASIDAVPAQARP
ncbi:glycosyltransferase [Pseudorhodoferax soli]|uniref:Glycosyl transferase family 4 n=1 Tax=Pseudorhodoferax soli TaxID=545864 RepID=A0A368Y6X6_9BURK|nr:glycosyltransferase [Pseudorhodoferax soli]RCW76041.1 glycosyl transferase family 4 [Pseudorhodoferax soli]